jgi:hypothetical protein
LISASVYGRDAAATDSMAMDDRNFAFKIATPIGFAVRGPQTYWNFSVAHKHLILRGHEKEIRLRFAIRTKSAVVERIRACFCFIEAVRQDGYVR